MAYGYGGRRLVLRVKRSGTTKCIWYIMSVVRIGGLLFFLSWMLFYGDSDCMVFFRTSFKTSLDFSKPPLPLLQ